MSGKHRDSRDREALAAVVAGLLIRSVIEVPYASSGHGYSNQAFTSSAIEEVLMVSYYDDYRILAGLDSEYGYLQVDSGIPACAYFLVNWLEIATKYKQLGTQVYSWDISYYDFKLRPVQLVNTNHIVELDRSSNIHNFAGDLQSSRLILKEMRSAETEGQNFLMLSGTRITTIVVIDHAKTEESPQVTSLNGYHGIFDGPGRFMQVMAGDMVKMEIHARYLDLREADPKVNPQGLHLR